MPRTKIDIDDGDDDACRAAMRRFRLVTKPEAVNFALRCLAVEPLAVGEALAMEGSG